jgi:hypothetical protein
MSTRTTAAIYIGLAVVCLAIKGLIVYAAETAHSEGLVLMLESQDILGARALHSTLDFAASVLTIVGCSYLVASLGLQSWRWQKIRRTFGTVVIVVGILAIVAFVAFILKNPPASSPQKAGWTPPPADPIVSPAPSP